MRRLLVSFVALAVMLLAATAAPAGDKTVLRVVVVKTDDLAAYTDQVKRGRTLFQRLGTPVTIRLWRATLAGDQAGSVVVSVEYPSLAAYADVTAKSETDAELSAWLKGLDKVRTIVSDSLYREIGD